MNQMRSNWQDTAAVLAAAAIALFALGWVAFHRPTEVEAPANIPYAQSGEFSYSAVPADERVYDSGAATSGEPVYRRLSEDVAFRFDYTFESSDPASTVGSYQMVAELGDSNGWKRTMELTPLTTFSGPEFSAEGVFNLAQAQALIAILEEQSGVKNEKYAVVLKPQVEISGTIGGTRFEDTFAPELPMSLDKVQLKMDAQQDNQTPLAPRTEGLVQTLQSETNTISLLALSMPVSGARAFSLAGLGLIVAVSGWLIISFVHRAGREAEGNGGIQNSVVNVRGTVPAPRMRMVDVASLDDLGRIAAKLGAVVLQEARPGYHAYFVHDMDITYRYEALGTEQEHSTEPVIPRKIA